MRDLKVDFHLHKSGQLLGFANLIIDGMTIKGFRLWKGRDGREFDIGFPTEQDQKGATDDNGKIKQWPLVYFAKNDEGKKAFIFVKEAIVSEFKKADGGKVEPKVTGGPTSGDLFPQGEEDDIPF